MTYGRLLPGKSTLLGSLAALLLITIGLAPAAHAQLGESTALFLRIEPDSRAAGMGNTGVALADNANAMFWNPAGLGFQRDTQVGFTHASWLPEFDAGLYFEYLAGTAHFDGIGTFGGHVTFLNLGEIEVRNGNGDPLNVERSFELSTGLSYGRQLNDNIAVGGGLRFIYSKLSPSTEDVDGQASTAALDLAALYRTNPFVVADTDVTVSTGLNISNIGGGMKYDRDLQAMPTMLRLGYAVTMDFDEYNSLTIANDFTKQLSNVDYVACDRDNNPETQEECSDPDTWFTPIFSSWSAQPGERDASGEITELSVAEQVTMGVGLEYWYSQLFALRTGYYYEDPKNGNREFLNFGAGFRYNIIGIDVSYIYTLEENNPLANTLRFSLLIDIR